MSIEELVQKATNGTVNISVSPEVLRESWESVAEITAAKILKTLNVQDKVLSEKEVCQMLKKSRQTISKYRKEGKLRFHRLSRDIIYYESEVKEDVQNLNKNSHE